MIFDQKFSGGDGGVASCQVVIGQYYARADVGLSHAG